MKAQRAMQAGVHRNARILIVDDQEANIHLLEGILGRAGYAELRGVTDPRDVTLLYAEFQPDLVLLDLHMPHLDGYAVMEKLRLLIPADAYLPILVLTADVAADARQRALSSGAKDFLTKPFDATEVLLRVRNLLETRFLHRQLWDHNQTLEGRVRQRTWQLEEARLEILERLALAAEFRDDDTGQHTQRVGKNATLLARVLGLPDARVELIGRAAPLHDVGKIGIPDHILLKPGALTADEFEVMKTHTTIGARILGGSRSPLLQMAEEIALTHHERWDDAGYPRGLSGDEIPIEGRIVAVADAFDAMTHDRPYRKARPDHEAWEILRRGAESQWDRRMVEAFESVSAGTREEGTIAPRPLSIGQVPS